MRSRKRLSMWSALPPYIGGKRKLAATIFREIDRAVPRRLWRSLTFLDGFMGGASIALFAKALGFGKVIGTDVALRSVVIGEALVANNRVRLTKADVLRVLAPREGGPGPIERELVPAAFTQSQARVIDNALALAAETGDRSKAALFRLLVIRLAVLAHPFSYVRRGTIQRLTTGQFEDITTSALPQYIAGLRLATVSKLWELGEEINAGVVEGKGEVHQVDIVEALPRFRADIAYFDPPYAGTLGYERTYRILDRILGDDQRDRSRFSSRNGAAELDQLLERAVHIPIWVLSFGQETVSLEELEGKMVKLGRQTRSIAVKYSRLAALAKEEKRSMDREYLVVGWDEEAPLLKGWSVGRTGVRDHELGRDVDRAVSSIHGDFNLGGSQRTAAQSLAFDAHEKGDASFPEQVAPERRHLSVPELQPGVDHPNPILGEPGLDQDDEPRVGTSVRHVPTLPWEMPGSQERREEKRR